ncbi:MAG: phosphate ABC transporter ATP-binding protein [Deltaproteobacteria bacterium]|nr:phosphate ABC transporter ATP-binding protein [Deltaproteobacteria bacterium]
MIAVADLAVHYRDKCAFAGVNLSVARGTITALVGPSGCGKSSLLSCLNRLVDMVPGARASGRVDVDGCDVLDPRLDLVAHRRRVGMIFQKPNPFPLSIRENIAFPLREHGVRDVGERVESALRAVGLWTEVNDRLDRPALGLSGGQQQRLCIARALALEPSVVLLDEPCSALDPIASGVVEDHVASLRGRYTVVIVTHNLAQARRIADHTAVFWVRGGTGYLAEHGATEQVFGSPRTDVAAAYVSGSRG